MHKTRQQNSVNYPMPIRMLNGTSAVTGLGSNVTVTLSKNGSSFASSSAVVSEAGNGVYYLAGNATDRNTLGSLCVNATGAGATPYRDDYTIVGYDPIAGSNGLLATLAPSQSYNNVGQTVALPGFRAVTGSALGNQAPAQADFTIGTQINWSQQITATGTDSTGWTQFVFSLKADATADADAAALITVKLTNPGAGTDGLVVLNGGTASAALGSLTVGTITPDTIVTWSLLPAATNIAPSPANARYRWALTRWIGTRKDVIGQGNVTVVQSVIRSTASL